MYKKTITRLAHENFYFPSHLARTASLIEYFKIFIKLKNVVNQLQIMYD